MADRVPVHTIFQHTAGQSGAAALGMVLSHFGVRLTIDALEEACGMHPSGDNPEPLLKAATLLGLQGSIDTVDAETALTAPVPAIVALKGGSFAVVEGMEDGQVCLNLPTDGPVHLDPDQFAARFAGVMLTLQPGPGFTPDEGKPPLASVIARYLKGTGPSIVIVVVSSVLLQLPNLAVPAFTQIFIDQVLLRDLNTWLFPLIAGLIVTAVFSGLASTAQLYFMKRMESQVAVATSAQMMWRCLTAPVLYFSRMPVGDAVARLGAARRLATLLTSRLGASFSNALTVTFYMGILMLYSVPLGLVSIVLNLLNVGVIKFVDRKRSALNAHQIQLIGQSCSVAVNGFKAIETMKAMGQESFFFGKQSDLSAKTIGNQQHIDTLSLFLNLAPQILMAINAAAILTLGALLVIDGNLTIGELVAFQMLTKRLAKPIQALVGSTQEIQELKSRLNAADEISRAPVDPVTRPREKQDITGKLTGHIELKDVRFAYNLNEPPLIDGLSLTIKPGSRVAFVGPSGSGKSTLCRIALGLYAPSAGAVVYDGHPIEDIARPVWAASVGYVSQDVSLFEGTIRENIDQTLPIADIRRAAKDADIDDVITARTGGYDAMVTEGGANFSGGQRQRIEIARALAQDPRILILDEATSALDSETELRIDNNLRRRGCTCLVIAHRLSTLRDADEIIYLDRGKIVERGTHDELISLNGHYAQLIKLA